VERLLFQLNCLFSQEVLYEALWPTNHGIFICNNDTRYMVSGVSKSCTKILKRAQTQIFVERSDN